jgi:hypothetical protein
MVCGVKIMVKHAKYRSDSGVDYMEEQAKNQEA